jgi:hypothetical protein
MNPGRKAGRLASGVLAAHWMLLAPAPAQAGSWTPKDLQVLGRAMAFLLPPPGPGTVVAVAYSASDDASRRDAEAVAAAMSDGLRVGNVRVPLKVVDTATVAAGGYRVVIAAQGVASPTLSNAVRAGHSLCVTTEQEVVQAGLCTMAIRSEPRVDILVNHAVAAADGVEFAAAFRMMIREF